MSVKIDKKELEDEGIQRGEANEEIETFTASEKNELVAVTFQIPKRLLLKLKEIAEMFEKPYGELIREAIEKKVKEVNDLSYLETVLQDDVVDEIIERLKDRSYLTPKACKIIFEVLKDKTTFSGENKWREFCRKMGISLETRQAIEDGSIGEVIYLKE